MKKTILAIGVVAMLASCNGQSSKTEEVTMDSTTTMVDSTTMSVDSTKVDTTAVK
jgi:hypothetical protein